MNLADCYRVLGLRSGASFAEIKASYRRLARQYHPDVNAGDQRAKEKFIELTAAYQQLLTAVQPQNQGAETAERSPQAAQSAASRPVKTRVVRRPPKVEMNPRLSEIEQRLKEQSYDQLQELLKHHRYPRAIALVEGLAQRIAHDPEVRQWQAIAYQRWGRHLIQLNQLDKARVYLKKALRTDPHNRSLWAEVERDFRTLEERY
ncbi:J domain-containing protein [Geitlerinema sp. PCC 7407]|uniref:J domain-containing protein n=1 Tax=Geitlerinema sp. PCC 7407 TaxID=1173025 RepID=UPI00029FCAB0|nr:J domain-containing protein [Geitlerinema sp. PCC 7407]AFY65361.1 heat shock protein DnaJ domain protein [Geitlerinema sp. PCC 7407]